jgi:uncharacterized protein (DUF111 family)
MANHIRQQIREAAATLLTGLTTTGVRVFQSRVYVLADTDLPALVISTNEEQAELGSVGFPSLLNRQLNLQVRAVAKGNSNLDDTLDTIIKEVETALNANVAANTLNGLAKNIELNSIFIDMNGEAESPTGQAVISFNVNYRTAANTPDISI